MAGGTGLIGLPSALELARAGYLVRILTRDPTRARRNLAERLGLLGGAASGAGRIELVHGDVTRPASLKAPLAGVSGLHISLRGGPSDRAYFEIETQGSINLAEAARAAGVRRITYLSGEGSQPRYRWCADVSSKLRAEAALMKCGIPSLILFASFFMEGLPLFVIPAAPGGRNRIEILGRQRAPWHWLAAADFGQMLARAHDPALPDFASQRLFIHGPEELSIPAALKLYAAELERRGGRALSIRTVPTWRAAISAAIRKDAELRRMARLFRYFELTGEFGDPRPADELLGRPQTTLAQWLAAMP